MAGGRITGPRTRNDAPDPDDWGMVVRVVGGVVFVGPVAVTQGTVPWIVSDPAVEAALDVPLSTRASEVTQLDVLAAIRTLDTGVFSAPFTGINGDVVTMVAAMPVAMPVASLMRAVNNSGFALANVIGLVVVGAAITLPVRALAEGVLTLPTLLWDAVTGAVGGLVPGARYYLGGTLGTLTTTAPITVGEYVTVIGSAISTTTMLVDPEPPILL